MTIQLKKRLLTVEEYHKMGEAGILNEKGIELIHGEIIEMSPISSRHAAIVDRINNLLVGQLTGRLAGKAIVRIQNPIGVDNLSESEPDISLLKYRDDFYADKHPEAKDILLVIEVADSSLEYDREIKLPIYASAGIPEYWVVNLQENQIEMYRNPFEHHYKIREIASIGDEVKLQSLDLGIEIRSILL